MSDFNGFTLQSFAYAPTSPILDGLVLDMDPSLGTSSVVDGTGLSSWTDQSPTGAVFVQATGARQPIFRTNLINGLPVVEFTNANSTFMSYATIPAVWQGGQITLCAIAKVKSVSPGDYGAVFATLRLTPGPDSGFRFGQWSGGGWELFLQNAGVGISCQSDTGIVSTALYQRVVGIADSVTPTERLFVRNSIQSATSGVPSTWTPNLNYGPAVLGGISALAFPNQTTQYLNGYVARVLMYNRILTPTELITNDNYFRSRYGLS